MPTHMCEHKHTHTPNIQSSAIPIVCLSLCVFCFHSFVAFGFVAWKYTPYSSYFIFIIGSILPLFDVDLPVMMFLRRKPFQQKIKIKHMDQMGGFCSRSKSETLFSKKQTKTNSAQHKWATIKYTSFVWHSYQFDKISKRTL